MKQVFEKIKVVLSQALNDDDKAMIKKYKTELADAVVAPETPTEPKQSTEKTVDGVELVIDGDFNIGAKVSTKNPESGEMVPAMDGEYVLESGKTITVVGGLITEIETPDQTATEPAEPSAPAMPDMTAKMQSHIESVDVKFNDLKKVVDGQNEKINFLLSVIEKITNAPVETGEVVESIPFEKMSALEKRRYLKSIK